MFNLSDESGIKAFSNFVSQQKSPVYFKLDGDKLVEINFSDFVELPDQDKQEVVKKIEQVIRVEGLNTKTIHKLKEIRNAIFSSSQGAAPETMRQIPRDVLGLIAAQTDLKDVDDMTRVNRKMRSDILNVSIQSLNQGKRLKDVLPPRIKTASQAIDWIIKAQKSEAKLIHADFRGFSDFTDTDVEKLTGHCPDLRSLFISNCKITNVGIAKLTGLTTLHLVDSQIGKTGAKEIAKLTGLTTLNLGGNQIGDDGAKKIAKLTGLTMLYLAGNDIGDDGAQEIAKLTHLTILDLRNNQIEETGAQEIAKLTGLTTLLLTNNQIGDAGAQEIAKLTGLTTLHLTKNQIGDAGAKEIAKLTHLTTLYLAGNRIGDAGAKEIAKLTRLTGLSLWANQIGDAGAQEIAKLTRLTALYLWDNQIGDIEKEKIRAAFPTRNISL